jgi:hypothetical protein
LDTTVPSGSVTGVIFPFPEAVFDGPFGEVLRTHPELVHLALGDIANLREVFGGLAHGHVDVRQIPGLARICPHRSVTARALGGAVHRGVKARVPPASADRRCRVRRQHIGVAARVTGNHFDAGRNEDVALARLDRVERHPRGLQR